MRLLLSLQAKLQIILLQLRCFRASKQQPTFCLVTQQSCRCLLSMFSLAPLVCIVLPLLCLSFHPTYTGVELDMLLFHTFLIP